uniref:Reverse transcriptase zinc-binding domain-containing protein n=1 Tax=Fagus sylvatica TaxID=28930 RepID=A0A2N9FQN7_FAGSY
MDAAFGKDFLRLGSFYSKWSWLLAWVNSVLMINGVGMLLKALFPSLFACSTSQSASIDSCLLSSGVGEGRSWNITFLRDFNDWEVDEVLAFFTFIYSKIPAGVNPDSMRWTLCQHGEFDVKSFYHALDVKIDIKFPWKAIWRAKAPRRVSFFVWSAAWGKILTCDNLMRRG